VNCRLLRKKKEEITLREKKGEALTGQGKKKGSYHPTTRPETKTNQPAEKKKGLLGRREKKKALACEKGKKTLHSGEMGKTSWIEKKKEKARILDLQKKKNGTVASGKR